MTAACPCFKVIVKSANLDHGLMREDYYYIVVPYTTPCIIYVIEDTYIKNMHHQRRAARAIAQNTRKIYS
jgi:hypothetical protein